jgi:hypothetical protein
MTEPADTQPVPAVRLIPESEQTPQEWADGVAATIGAIFKHNHPDGKDWA